jgi:hypothetical protein
MIIKSISHSSHRASIKNLVAYIFGDKQMENEKGESVTITNLLRGDRNSWAKQFERIESRRKSFYANKEVRLYHEILSFSPDGPRPTKAELEDLIWKYFELRLDAPILAFGAVHFSDHTHAHLCIQGVDAYGASIRMSKKDFRDNVQQRLNQYQQDQYPHLNASIVDYSKASKEPSKLHSHKSWQRKERTGEKTKRERSFEIAQSAFLKSNSIEAFIAELALAGATVYYRQGKLTGVIYKGQKDRLKKSLGIDFELLLKPDLQQERIDRLRKLKEERGNDKNLER